MGLFLKTMITDLMMCLVEFIGGLRIKHLLQSDTIFHQFLIGLMEIVMLDFEDMLSGKNILTMKYSGLPVNVTGMSSIAF